ncbi:MAG: hypothetical protein ACRC33_16515, partial [Gemmataceae bacterium]
MKRSLLLATLLAVASCQSGPERGTLPAPLPEKVTVQSYGSLLERARKYATVATEASHVDDWIRLDESAKGLEQTAAYLIRADDVPAKHKDNLPVVSADLRKLAKELVSAVTAKDVNKTTDVLTRVNNKVREMRLG